jgi:hypothetical protein
MFCFCLQGADYSDSNSACFNPGSLYLYLHRLCLCRYRLGVFCKLRRSSQSGRHKPHSLGKKSLLLVF